MRRFLRGLFEVLMTLAAALISLFVSVWVTLVVMALAEGTLGAATITSNATGLWASGGTWVGGVAPGNGDSAIIANGHVVTIALGTTVTVGTSPISSGTAAIACATTTGTGSLTINGTLIYRGNVSGCNNITIGPGAVVTHDNTVGADQTYTDLVIDGTALKLSSAAHPIATTSGGQSISITGGAGCTVGKYSIIVVSANVATMSSSPGTAASTCTGTLMPAYYFTPVIASSRDSRIIVNGTNVSRVTFNVAAGATASNGFWWTSVGADSGMITGSYADVSDCGLPGGPGPAGDGNFCVFARAVTKNFTIDHFRFVRSGSIALAAVGAGANTTIDSSNFSSGVISKNGAQSEAIQIGTGSVPTTVAPTTGVRRLSGNYFDSATAVVWNTTLPSGGDGSHIGFTVTNNVWRGVQPATFTTTLQMFGGATSWVVNDGEWHDNLFYITVIDSGTQVPSAVLPSGTLHRTYQLNDNTSNLGGTATACTGAGQAQNYHPFYTSSGTAVIDQLILEPQCAPSFTSNGVLVQPGQWGAAFNVEVKNSIAMTDMPGTGGYSFVGLYTGAGTCTNSGSSWCPTLIAHNNTFMAGFSTDSCGIGAENTGAMRASMFNGGYDNIAWLGSSGAGCIEGTQATLTPIAGTYAGTWDYNWRYNLTGTVYVKSGVAGAYSNGTPGTHDSTGNPQFKDTNARFLKWAQTINAGDTTWGAVFTNRYALRGTDAYDTSYDVTHLIDYVEAGWAPTNAATATASSTGGQVGAVAFVPLGYPRHRVSQ